MRDLLWEYVKRANINAFGVDVDNYAEMQFTEYHGTENGHYHWHHDIHWTADVNSDRKLSITVQLSDPEDYEGGTSSSTSAKHRLTQRLEAQSWSSPATSATGFSRSPAAHANHWSRGSTDLDGDDNGHSIEAGST